MVGMKQISTSGNTLIVKQRPTGKHISHDIWPNHAVQYGDSQMITNNSGKVIHVVDFNLEDGLQYFYLTNEPGTLSQAEVGFNLMRVANFPIPGAIWTGENWNLNVMPLVLDKWTPAQLSAWLLT